MEKRAFIARVAAKTGQTKRATEQTMDALFQTMTEVLCEGDRVLVSNFGTFTTVHRAPKVARNPRTGERIPLPAATTVLLKPSQELKDKLNPPMPEGNGG